MSTYALFAVADGEVVFFDLHPTQDARDQALIEMGQARWDESPDRDDYSRPTTTDEAREFITYDEPDLDVFEESA